VGMAQMKGSRRSFQPQLTGPGSLAGKEKIAEGYRLPLPQSFQISGFIAADTAPCVGGTVPRPV